MFRRSILCFSIAMLMASVSFGDVITNSGELTKSDPTWNNPDRGIVTFYDAFDFTAPVDGTYYFLSFYDGDVATDANLDGYLNLHGSPFDAANPGSPIESNDDYTAGDIMALADHDAACAGQNCSGFEAVLTGGTTYTLVQSSFDDAPSSFGQNVGPYAQTIVTPEVPAPAASLLGLIGMLSGIVCLRRRS